MAHSRKLTREEIYSRLEIVEMKPAPPPVAARKVELGPDRAALRTGDHAAILYWSAHELLDTIVPYLKAGLDGGDKVVYVADDLQTGDIAEALRRTGVNVPAAMARGQLMLVSAKDAFFGDGVFDVERALAGVRALAEQAARDGFARVRFSVEMTYLLANVPGIEAGVEFESRANDEVFAKFPFVCICSFNAGRATEEKVIADVFATHPIVISAGSPLLNPHYRPWSELARDKR